MEKKKHTGNLTIFAIFFILLDFLLSIVNVWIGLILGLIAIFFAYSAKKAGKKATFIFTIVIFALSLIVGITQQSAKNDNSNQKTTQEQENESSSESNIQSTELDSTVVPDYKVGSTQEYARDGKKCMGYRVAVDSQLSDDELKAIFDDITADDYYLHIVWFFSDVEKASGADPYDIAMMEETDESSEPILTRVEKN